MSGGTSKNHFAFRVHRLSGVAACALAAGLMGLPAAHAATRSPEIIAAENCDPIVIPQPAAKKPVKKAVSVRKAARPVAQSAPAKPLPKPVKVKAEGAAVAQAKSKPRPRPKPKTVAVAQKPMVIPDACPGAGSNPEDVAGLPTNLKDLMAQSPEALASVFPDPAAGGYSPLTTSLTSLASTPRQRASTPGNTGPTVPLIPGGGSVGGGGDGGSDDTTPVDPPGGTTPPTGGNPPTDNTPPGGNPPGGNPPGENPPGGNPPGGNPPVKVPEPGTLGIALGGLAGLVALSRRRRRA